MYIYPTVDMEGKLLKIRLKMISLFLIIILIPLIFLYVYLSKISMDQVSASQVQALKNINETKADYIADVIIFPLTKRNLHQAII